MSSYCLRDAPFATRVAAAAGAGFAGIGLSAANVAELEAAGRTPAEVRAVLDEHDLVLHELEVLAGWDGDEDQRTEEQLFTFAAAMGGVHHVQAIAGPEGQLDRTAADFGALCDRAAAHGVAVALEFIPQMTHVADALSAWWLVEAAGRSNGGLCVDTWHHFRGADDEGLLRQVPAERVFAVQFDDGPRRPGHPDYLTDTVTNRVVPGAGEFDLVGFVRLLDEVGVDVPLSVEVISAELRARPAAQAALAIAEGTRAVVARARA
jgi:sugar phosphate isomerase/epimerase